MNDVPRGAVFSEKAYALGKMLDHSSWQTAVPKLLRNITASDVDLTFDNDGSIIFGELSSSCCDWNKLGNGQLRLYQNLIKGGPHCAALAKHSVAPDSGRLINTRTDIESFHLMFWDYGVVYSRVIQGNNHWQRFVVDWVNDGSGPLRLRRKVLGASVDLPQDIAA